MVGVYNILHSFKEAGEMNRKIYCRTEEESIAVQEKAFRLGYAWLDSGKEVFPIRHMIYIQGGTLLYTDYERTFLSDTGRYTEVADFLDLPEPKREFDLKPFDRVLVRDAEIEAWYIDLFVARYPKAPWFNCLTTTWNQIAPYEGNEKYLGTCDDIPGS